MKRISAMLLLLALMLQVCSCIQANSDLSSPHLTEKNTQTDRTYGENSAPAEVLFSPWTDAEGTAELFFEAEGLIVDASEAEYSYYEMVDDLKALEQAYSAHFSYHSIGRSVVGREIYVAVLGNPDAQKQMLVSAGIHGREYLTPLLVMKQMEFYLAYYDTGECNGVRYSALFDEYCFYVVPMTNPDGIMLSQEGISTVTSNALYTKLYDIYNSDFSKKRTDARTIDEYLKEWKANVSGVDLNRNFDALWNEYKKGTSVPSYNNYKGPAAASEPETQAMVALTESLSNIQAVLCIHSQGEVLYWDCGQNDSLSAKTRAFTVMLAARTGYTIVDEQNNDASFSDWCALEKELIAITVETGYGACPLPISQFSTIWKDNFDLLPLSAVYFE